MTNPIEQLSRIRRAVTISRPARLAALTSALTLGLVAPVMAASGSWSGWLTSAKGKRVPQTSISFRYSHGKITNFHAGGVLTACGAPHSEKVSVRRIAFNIPAVTVRSKRFSAIYQFGKHKGDAYDRLTGRFAGKLASGVLEQHTKAGACETYPLQWAAHRGRR
jgi:hypothetical protein